ncbi:flagellar hook-basal body complex protein FliE [Ferrimonas balearica]|uniref:flagellar hook-basal body complex protein FliE n=1 Tax=Ferrimonas balearica TaxID=44012 RepID=UPI001C998CB4|nr:flagellar hook-basal body complex protein FliE [Ferrimonas balearica]MBY5921303.1 flagellar hook-basal body complex protein FliE [Ferrimonas balearica]MBY5996012.1 flagellar hook-basal body complex protein FliE [Ferrimonas balearica]
MEIGNNPLLVEMQSLAREAGSSAELAPVKPQQDFSAFLTDAIDHVNGLQMNASDLATRLELGDTRVSLSDTMIAKEKAGVAFEATVQVRNKLVEAYKEIMNMPV